MLLTGCSNDESSPAESTGSATDDKVVIITSLKPFALMIDEAYGDFVESSYLVPPEQSPHHVTLRPSAVNRLRSADLLIWAGPELESFLPGLLSRFGFEHVDAASNTSSTERRLQLAALEVLPAALLVEYGKSGLSDDQQTELPPGAHAHALGSVDPHFWLSLAAVEALLVRIEQIIVRLHLGDVSGRSAQGETLQKQLSGSRQAFMDRLKRSFPASGSAIVDSFPLVYSYHPAFNYLLRELGIPDEGYLTRNPESGVPPSAIAAFLETAAENEICMLAEPQYTLPVERLMAKLAGGAKKASRTVVADPLGVEADSFSDLYAGVRKALRACLGAQARPESDS
ncbi:metal ABC transporter substrate-binding protein [Allohahella marinimesophila]|uniref:High-affinity zinc uptake system protein ZnuA n=1 Tax=Allohahella marinimesophila TaxID=1054972 RepID=A0ABP7NVD1_9GAMM